MDAPGQARVPQEAWERVTASNSKEPLELSISRWDAASETAYASASVSFTIAPESLRGAIYYWMASGIGQDREGSITRIQPGTGSMPEKLNEGKCMGCHSVSADGSTLVATVEDPSAPSEAPYAAAYGKTRAWASFSLPDGDLIKQTTKSGGNSALTPDGKYVVFGAQSNLVEGERVPGSKFISLGVTKTGDVIADSGLDDMVPEEEGMGFMMPAFSPNGKMLALVEANGDLDDNVLPTPSNRIVYVDFDQGEAKFEPELHEVVRADAFPPTTPGSATRRSRPTPSGSRITPASIRRAVTTAARTTRPTEASSGLRTPRGPRTSASIASTIRPAAPTTTRTASRPSTRRSAVATRGSCSRACATGATSSRVT